jgi:type II secretory pathway pseudopilin PulG
LKADRVSFPPDKRSMGFTLIELLVSMVVVMVILAGLYSNFLMQSRVQASQSSTVDAVEDLRLTSQIMATQLRLASFICWDATNKRLVYQPLGTQVALTKAACETPPYTIDPAWGAFQYSSGTAATGGTLCWDQPGKWAAAPNGLGYGCQQVLRGLNQTTGFSVSPTSNTSPDLTVLRTLSLTSQYQNIDRQNKDLTVTFDALPRNNN